MIELRGLHMGNIARSPAESARPDLWPDHAWVPALGCTGGVLYDLCQKVSLSAIAPAWAIQGGVVVTRHNDTESARFLSPNALAYDLALPWTAVCVARPASASTDQRPLACWDDVGSSDGDGGFAVWYDIGGTAAGWSFAFYRNVAGAKMYRLVGNNTASGGTDRLSAVACGWSGGQSGAQFLIVDGALVTDYANSVGNPLYPGVTHAKMSVGGHSVSPTTSTMMDGDIAVSIFYRSALTPSQIFDLTADPLLPFRRRQPVFYSVPSGGGSIETPAAMMMAL